MALLVSIPALVAARLYPFNGPHQIWHDEFSGVAGARPSASWQFQTGGGGWGNHELEVYTDERQNAELDGHGHLLITARRTVSTTGVTAYTSARLTTQGARTFTYGTLQARIEVPAGTGLLPAFWLLGADLPTAGYPGSGEIDVLETPGDSRTSYATIHGPLNASPTQAYAISRATTHKTPLSAGYHTYTLVRRVDLVEMKIDGVIVQKLTPGSLASGQEWVFDRPFFILLDVAVGGDFPGPVAADTHFPATMKVDWLRLST